MQRRTRAAALVAAAAVMTGLLAGRGGAPQGAEPTGPAAGGTGTVWQSERRKIDGVEGLMKAKAVSEGKLYFTTSVTDEETYEEHERLWSAPLEGGKAESLAQYEEPKAPEGADSIRRSVNSMAASGVGLWLYETVNGTVYELPEGFSGEEYEKYDYAKDVSERRLRLVDAATGAEKLTAELDKALDAVKSTLQLPDDEPYVSSMSADAEGNLCAVFNQTAAALFSKDGALLGVKPLPGWWDSALQLRDGRAAVAGSEESDYVLRPVDFAAGGFGSDLPLPVNPSRICAGGGKYGSGYVDGVYIYGVDAESGKSTRLAGLLDCGIDENELSGVYLGEAGDIYCLVDNYSADKTQLLRLTELSPEEAAKRVTLRLACNWLSPSLNKAILNFNTSGGGARIEVTDYSRLATDEDFSAGVTKLNTEILSGNVPDIFVTTDLPIAQYAAKGLLRDLYEFIDADKGGRERFMTGVLKAMETDGKLYSIAPAFTLSTLVGKSSVVGEKPGWTLSELQEVIKAHPEAKYILGQGMTRSFMLDTMLKYGLERYVDWQKGECSFNSQDFIDMLDFLKMFPEEFTYDDPETGPYELMSDGRQLLLQYDLRDFVDYQTCIVSTKGEAVFKGYPTAEGVGNVLSYADSPLCISTACKAPEEAWRFISSLLDEDSDEIEYFSGLPINARAYDAAEAEAMKKETYKDEETGEVKEWPRRTVGWGDFTVDIYAMTKEEAQALRELINSTDRSTAYDKNVMNIVSEELQSFFSGAKSAEDTARLIQDRVGIYVNEQR